MAKALWAVGIVFGWAGMAHADLKSSPGLLREPGVRRRLRLTPAQNRAVETALSRAHTATETALRADDRKISYDNEFIRQASVALEEVVLTGDQRRTLLAIGLGRMGPGVVNSSEVAEEIVMTPDQREKVQVELGAIAARYATTLREALAGFNQPGGQAGGASEYQDPDAKAKLAELEKARDQEGWQAVRGALTSIQRKRLGALLQKAV